MAVRVGALLPHSIKHIYAQSCHIASHTLKPEIDDVARGLGQLVSCHSRTFFLHHQLRDAQIFFPFGTCRCRLVKKMHDTHDETAS